jgi:hypothetical protein
LRRWLPRRSRAPARAPALGSESGIDETAEIGSEQLRVTPGCRSSRRSMTCSALGRSAGSREMSAVNSAAASAGASSGTYSAAHGAA